jgi:hypothetical protein
VKWSDGYAERVFDRAGEQGSMGVEVGKTEGHGLRSVLLGVREMLLGKYTPCFVLY